MVNIHRRHKLFKFVDITVSKLIKNRFNGDYDIKENKH